MAQVVSTAPAAPGGVPSVFPSDGPWAASPFLSSRASFISSSSSDPLSAGPSFGGAALEAGADDYDALLSEDRGDSEALPPLERLNACLEAKIEAGRTWFDTLIYQPFYAAFESSVIFKDTIDDAVSQKTYNTKVLPIAYVAANSHKMRICLTDINCFPGEVCAPAAPTFYGYTLSFCKATVESRLTDPIIGDPLKDKFDSDPETIPLNDIIELPTVLDPREEASVVQPTAQMLERYTQFAEWKRRAADSSPVGATPPVAPASPAPAAAPSSPPDVQLEQQSQMVMMLMQQLLMQQILQAAKAPPTPPAYASGYPAGPPAQQFNFAPPSGLAQQQSLTQQLLMHLPADLREEMARKLLLAQLQQVSAAGRTPFDSDLQLPRHAPPLANRPPDRLAAGQPGAGQTSAGSAPPENRPPPVSPQARKPPLQSWQQTKPPPAIRPGGVPVAAAPGWPSGAALQGATSVAQVFDRAEQLSDPAEAHQFLEQYAHGGPTPPPGRPAHTPQQIVAIAQALGDSFAPQTAPVAPPPVATAQSTLDTEALRAALAAIMAGRAGSSEAMQYARSSHLVDTSAHP
eukprot:GHVT01064038.1.p1 GENE.GHVT01064038.1~~GHVT01064038.1.p1  ORF type:complete len:574 (+),score=163.49 GHVT01064038.1:350-2071(+)